MVHAPEVTDFIKASATKMDAVSDDIDQVNVIKGKKDTYEDESEFDAAKDKAGFRQYEDACDRVKNFYAVCLMMGLWRFRADLSGATPKTDFGIQLGHAKRVHRKDPGSNEYLASYGDAQHPRRRV